MTHETTHPRVALLLCISLLAAATGACSSRPQRPETISRSITIDEGKRIDEAIAYIERAEEAHDNNEPEAAVEYYRRSIESYAEIHAAWNNLGVELMKLKRYQDAEEAFRMAASVERTDPRPYYNLGTLYQAVSYDDQAYEYYTRAIERRPNYLPALRGAIQSADFIDRLDSTTLDWIRAAILLEADPDWLEYFQRLRLEIESRLVDDEL